VGDKSMPEEERNIYQIAPIIEKSISGGLDALALNILSWRDEDGSGFEPIR
jgi:hypothetical protein